MMFSGVLTSSPGIPLRTGGASFTRASGPRFCISRSIRDNDWIGFTHHSLSDSQRQVCCLYSRRLYGTCCYRILS